MPAATAGDRLFPHEPKRGGNMRTILGFFLGLLLVTATPGCSTPNQDTLKGDRFDPVRTLIDQRMKEHKIASFSIAAAQDGKIVGEESFGWAD